MHGIIIPIVTTACMQLETLATVHAMQPCHLQSENPGPVGIYEVQVSGLILNAIYFSRTNQYAIIFEYMMLYDFIDNQFHKS